MAAELSLDAVRRRVSFLFQRFHHHHHVARVVRRIFYDNQKHNDFSVLSPPRIIHAYVRIIDSARGLEIFP